MIFCNKCNGVFIINLKDFFGIDATIFFNEDNVNIRDISINLSSAEIDLSELKCKCGGNFIENATVNCYHCGKSLLYDDMYIAYSDILCKDCSSDYGATKLSDKINKLIIG